LICAVFLLWYCLILSGVDKTLFTVCLTLLYFCWISCVARGENLVLTCLCFALFSHFWLYRWLGWWWRWVQNLVWIGLDFAWFLLFDGLVLLDLGYFITIVIAWRFVVPGYCIGCLGMVWWYCYCSLLWLYCLCLW
jgi:hypothetical protein